MKSATGEIAWAAAPDETTEAQEEHGWRRIGDAFDAEANGGPKTPYMGIRHAASCAGLDWRKRLGSGSKEVIVGIVTVADYYGHCALLAYLMAEMVRDGCAPSGMTPSHPHV